MEKQLMYESPLTGSVSVRDRWGKDTGVMTNDGVTFSLEWRGNRFVGHSPDSLELVGEAVASAEPPGLDRGDLCGYELTWSTPVTVMTGAGTERFDLTTQLTVPNPHAPAPGQEYGVSLSLAVPGGDVSTARHGDMESALLELQRNAPDGMRMAICSTCALSDHHPVGYGFMGDLACFRNSKEQFREVSCKSDLFDVGDSRAGHVQETYHCPDFE
ncbi:DUF6304 family protein [Streptomyces sp. M-16]|uniref:DUF6304 family protein n=1 Tax=Streptomyces sp. M-16 TaxID=3233040 RepID=UPI003F9C84E5